MQKMIYYNNSVNDFSKQSSIDKSVTNHFQSNENMYANNSDKITPSEYFPFINVMNDIDTININDVDDQELHEKILKHKKTSNYGFNSLQKRIEKVKNDLKNLTNKISSNNFDADVDDCNIENGHHNDKTIDEDKEDIHSVHYQRSNGLYSQKGTTNPFSELSENTQKVLGRLHLKEEDSKRNDTSDNEELQIEMEEDDIEFSFSIRSNSLLNDILSKSPMPIIDEEDEDGLSSEEDSESIDSVIHAAITVYDECNGIPNSSSLHSFDITESGSYRTPILSNEVQGTRITSNMDTDEYFSDFAKCSGSMGSSTESLRSQDIDMSVDIDTEDQNEINQNFNMDQEENCPSFIKEDDELLFEDEFVNSTWSSEDLLESDSMYNTPSRPLVKSSLPNLVESADNPLANKPRGTLITKHFNKSTDLDELLVELPPFCGTTKDRLSQSMCELFVSKPGILKKPNKAFQDGTSQENLLETDLDSGYVSIYKPSVEAEISPTLKFSRSMGNVSHLPISAPLINKLRQKAGSISELRIAESLTKLNIPTWLTLKDDDYGNDNKSGVTDNNRYALPIICSPTFSDRSTRVTQRREPTGARPLSATHVTPISQSKPSTPVMLPSQLLRLNSQKKLMPITMCKARQLLLPNKVNIPSLTQPTKASS